jgi:hypothetical protein
MPHTHTISASSSRANFQIMFDIALEVYKERIDNDIYPLAAQLQSLQTCSTPSSILAVFQEQFKQLDKSQDGDDQDERRTKPKASLRFAFAKALALTLGVVLFQVVCLVTCAYLIFAFSYLFGREFSYLLGRCSHLRTQSSLQLAFFFLYVSSMGLWEPL